MYDFTSFVEAISGYLQATFSGFWAGVVSMLLLGIVILMFYAFLGLFLVYAERKICARMQNRIGPNRVDLYSKCGLLPV
jgi:NADH-quinone oxidoreductase subunit H